MRHGDEHRFDPATRLSRLEAREKELANHLVREAEDRRIRDAAPELLAALEKILWLVDQHQLIERASSHCGPLIFDEARAAIAKARGEG